MLFVILFHVALDRGDPFYGLRRCGNVGVDIFLFLSGVGLWFAWTKTPCISHFYRRRLLRILPTWLVCSTAFYLPDYLGARRYSQSIVDLIGDITINWDFWLHDELTFWYVPAIMLLYLLAPWYMMLVQRHPISCSRPFGDILESCTNILYRYQLWRFSKREAHYWQRCGVAVADYICHDIRHMPLSRTGKTWQLPAICRAYVVHTLYSVLVMNRIFRRTPEWLNRAFRLVGALSLEAYLIHIHFVLVYVQPCGLGYWGTFAVTVVITLPLAWLLQRGIGLIERIFQVRNCKKQTI